ncbi:MAG: hypothetical protein JWR26_2701 [Pedosphaera sp.]|nr:hypothetical protein [Pedosphaera sp.]
MSNPLDYNGRMNTKNSSWCLRTATMGAKGTGPLTARRRSEAMAWRFAEGGRVSAKRRRLGHGENGVWREAAAGWSASEGVIAHGSLPTGPATHYPDLRGTRGVDTRPSWGQGCVREGLGTRQSFENGLPIHRPARASGTAKRGQSFGFHRLHSASIGFGGVLFLFTGLARVEGAHGRSADGVLADCHYAHCYYLGVSRPVSEYLGVSRLFREYFFRVLSDGCLHTATMRTGLDRRDGEKWPIWHGFWNALHRHASVCIAFFGGCFFVFPHGAPRGRVLADGHQRICMAADLGLRRGEGLHRTSRVVGRQPVLKHA